VATSEDGKVQSEIRARRPWRRVVVVCAVAAALVGCGRSEFEGGGDLRARKVVLKREVDGLRAIVARLERGEPMLPKDDVAISIAGDLVRDLITAQLPFELDVDRFHLRLSGAEVLFRGSPVVKLRGTLFLREKPQYVAEVTAIGALQGIDVEPATGMLKAEIAIDHLSIEQAGGLEKLVSRAAMDEAARTVRLQLRDSLPELQIPVKLQQSVELPAVTSGPVRIDGAKMPIQVGVSEVVATRDVLWISIHFAPGDLVKTEEAPEAGDTKASDVGAMIDEKDVERTKNAKKDEKKKKEAGK
jgi:hypothetical protein